MAEMRMKQALDSRNESGLLRQLSSSSGADFSSNDYLGLAKNADLLNNITQMYEESLDLRSGSTGSRLLSGNYPMLEQVECFLATFHRAETACLFNSGFDANYGLFSCVAGKHDSFVFDELVHNSCHQGMRASRCFSTQSFKHNDISDLKVTIDRVNRETFSKFGKTGQIFVAVESIYSMDGDFCPLSAIVETLKQYSNINLIIDEAHSTGLVEQQGRGLVSSLLLESYVFARVHTFGKAMGCHGAVVLGSNILKLYLLNYASPIIFSTAPPLHSIVSIKCSYEYMIENGRFLNENLSSLINRFRKNLSHLGSATLLDSSSPIQGIVIPGNLNVVRVAKMLQKLNLDVRPIRSPTVPVGSERLRVCIHANNSMKEVDYLTHSITKILDSGLEEYDQMAKL